MKLDIVQTEEIGAFNNPTNEPQLNPEIQEEIGGFKQGQPANVPMMEEIGSFDKATAPQKSGRVGQKS